MKTYQSLTRDFELRLPKLYIKDTAPDWDKLDYKFTVVIKYWKDSNGEYVSTLEGLIDLMGYVDWDNPMLKRYILAAIENNDENTNVLAEETGAMAD